MVVFSVSDVMALSVYATSCVSKVGQLPVYALSCVAEVRQLSFYALSLVVAVFVIFLDPLFSVPLPWSFSAAPSASDPLADAPDPPSCDLCVEAVWVSEDFGQSFLSFCDEPVVSCVEVGFGDWPVGPFCDFFWLFLDGAPEVADEAVGVVDCFCSAEWLWSCEQDGA